MSYLKTPPKVPKDPKRSFKIRSRNMMKKSVGLTDIGARVAFFMQFGDEKVVFQTHPDLVPQWNSPDVNQLTPADLPTEPDYSEFRYPSSSPWSSPRPRPSPLLSSASLQADPEPTAASQHQPSFSPPTLDTFSISGLDILQLPVAGESDPLPPIEAISPSDLFEPVAQPSKGRRPASMPVTKPAGQRPRKRAKTSSWFD